LEITQLPHWSLPLRLKPEILAVGFSTIGILQVEEYNPVPYWQIGLFEGPAVVELRKAEQPLRMMIKPQDIFVIPPNCDRTYFAEDIVSHFYLSFQFALENSVQELIELPALIPCGLLTNTMLRDFTAAIDLWESDRFESDLLSRLILWRLVRLSRMTEPAEQDRAGIIQETLKRIRQNLGNYSLTPDSLARIAGLSRRRLDQLFIQGVGKPVAVCIRDRRLQHAQYLLHQTSLPIRVIGMQVGFSDPHGFNKFIRRNCGMSPSVIRSAEHSRSEDKRIT